MLTGNKAILFERSVTEDSDRFRLYESVLDQVRERIYVVGPNYRYRYANRRVIEFEGWTANEIVGRHVAELVGDLVFKRLVKPKLDRCFRGEDVSFQHWITTRSGRRQYIDVLLTPFREWNGKINGAIVTISDKTAQKTLQDDFTEQSDLYRQLVENSLTGIAILQGGSVVFANQAFTTMFGYNDLESLRAEHDPLGFIACHDREWLRPCLTAYEASKFGPKQCQFDGISRSGRILHIFASTNVVFWQGKSACQLVLIDVTERKRAERALLETAASFQDVVEGSPQGFFAIEGDQYTYVNRAFADLLGYSVDQMKSAPIESFFAAHEREDVNKNRYERFQKKPPSRVCERDALHKDGHIIRIQQCVRSTENWFGRPAILGFVIDVTDSHQARKALQNERNLLRTMIDNIPAVVFAKDREGRFLIKNKAGAEFVGETDPKTLAGKSNHDFYPDDLVGVFRRNEIRVMETGEALIDNENKVVCPGTGKTVVMSGCIAPLRDDTGEIVGIVGISQDITDFRDYEAALRESEQRFRDIVQASSDWFWEMDAELRFSYFSDRVAELSGTDIEATLGKKRSEIAIKIDDSCRQHFNDLESRRPFRNFRYVKHGNDGKTYHISISGVPIYDDEGRFKGYRGAGTNITKEVEAQQALAKERNLLRAIIDNIPDAIYAKDRQARFTLKNAFDAKLMGAAKSDETIGKTDFDYYPKEIADELFQDDMQVMESGIPIVNKVEQLVRSGCGEAFWYSTTKLPLRDVNRTIVGLVGIGRDITEAKYLEDRLQHQATHDSLTDLLNRAEFERGLASALAKAKSTNRSSVLCYIDLDQFKILNDSAGHMAGDQLIRQMASLFGERADAIGAMLARLGGDEFGLLVEACTLDQGKRIAQDLIDATNMLRFSWEGRTFGVSISVGLTVIDENLRDVDDALTQADIACYAAKDNGRGRLCVYQASDAETWQRHQDVLRAASLEQAIANNNLTLMAQPIVRLGNDALPVSHYEILLRLQGPAGEWLLPGAFIPAAERYGLMSMIDQWVVETSLEAISDIARPADGFRFNINLSGHSLTDAAFQDSLRGMLRESKLPTESLCFEITETAVISNLTRAKRFVSELRDLGCRIALDDFGCGLSSFSYLKHFLVDYIKIDGSFIKHIADDATDRAIVEAINHVSHVGKLQTVAECVEDEALIVQLRELQIDYAQGLALGSAEPLADVLASLRLQV
ncbi:MAG: PAS domain S-box protein [Pseudomonadota bacterium]